MTAIDTNVFIYACDSSDREKQRLAMRAIENAEDGVLLWQVACEFIAASRKLGKLGFTPANAWDRLYEFVDIFPLILPSVMVLEHAARFQLERGVSYWDALLLAACVDCSATRLLTEDIPSSVNFGALSIENPFAGD